MGAGQPTRGPLCPEPGTPRRHERTQFLAGIQRADQDDAGRLCGDNAHRRRPPTAGEHAAAIATDRIRVRLCLYRRHATSVFASDRCHPVELSSAFPELDTLSPHRLATPALMAEGCGHIETDGCPSLPLI